MLLAKDERNRIYLTCVNGDGLMGYNRGLLNNNLSCLGILNGVLLYALNDDNDGWSTVSDVGDHRSLFLGPGYHFFYHVPEERSVIKSGRIYISNLRDTHVGVFILADTWKARFTYEHLDFPVVGDPLQAAMFFRTPALEHI